MTEPAEDSRVIDIFADVYNATLVHRVDQTPDLAYFWVKVDGPAGTVQPGQYMTIGVLADGKLLQRPYSVASAPRDAGDEGYEFYVRLVPILRFTTALWRLPGGATGCGSSAPRASSCWSRTTTGRTCTCPPAPASPRSSR